MWAGTRLEKRFNLGDLGKNPVGAASKQRNIAYALTSMSLVLATKLIID